MNWVTLLCGRLYKNLIALPILLSGGECKQAGSSSHSCLFAFIDFFSLSLLFFFSNGRHCASCQNVVIENNTPCECVFVCVESVLVPENNVCMCESGWALWTFTACYLYAAVKWAHCTKKKKILKETQSACHGIGGRLANQNTDTSLIELSCCVLSPRLCVLKSNQSRWKRGQVGHRNQLSASRFVCLFANPHTHYLPL